MTEPNKLKAVTGSPPTPPVKDCEKSQRAEPHIAHDWEKKPGWKLWCEGVLPLDEQPPCQWYISPERPECGEAAPVKIRVKTRLIDARIDVCIPHKRKHDNIAALRRANGTQGEHRKAS